MGSEMSDSSNPQPPIETIYDKILRLYPEYAIQKDEDLDLNQTSTTDIENPGGYVMPSDMGTRNCIMNNYCYQHCRDCQVDQPPRSYHCPLCGRCVLRYDHHCAILANCIGFHNFKPFVLLHFYTAMGGINIVFWYMMGIKLWGFGSTDTLYFWVQYVVPLFLCCMLTFGCIGQFFMYMYLALKNRTQLEVIQDYRHNIFDTGDMMENFKYAFGDTSKIWWFLPVDSSNKPTDGHHYNFYYYSK